MMRRRVTRAQVRYPWTVDPLFASEHTNRYSDVSFKYGFVEGADNSGTLRWKVHGSRFYARNSIKGRAFLANWFANRCTFKDQYSLWHTILNFAASEGCVDYDGEIYSKFRYMDAEHLKQDKARARLPDARARLRAHRSEMSKGSPSRTSAAILVM